MLPSQDTVQYNLTVSVQRNLPLDTSIKAVRPASLPVFTVNFYIYSHRLRNIPASLFRDWQAANLYVGKLGHVYHGHETYSRIKAPLKSFRLLV